MKSLLELEQLVQETLSPRRYAHSVNVSREAVRLAQRYGEDAERARMAGLLHDICKELPPQEQLQWVEKSDIIFDELLYRQPQVLHGPAAAEYVRERLNITDEDLLNATGGIVQGMSGSPIIQDGKLVGAVTHVFINDPTQGYGVYIEWMLDAAAQNETGLSG